MKDGSLKTWVTAEIGDIVAVSRPRSDPQEHPDMPFIGMDNVEAQTMRLLGTVPARTMKSNATHFFPGDVLYGRLRPYLNKVIAPGFEGLASAEFIPLTPEVGIFPDFIRYRLNAADFVSFTSHLDEGDRPRIDWDSIRRFKVLLPPSAEQQRIVEAIDSYLTRLDDAVANLERVQAKLKAYTASVLKAAVEGSLVPTEASLARAEKRDYEPANALLARILKERRRRWEEAEFAKLKAAGKTPKDDKWKATYQGPMGPDARALPELPEGWCWTSLGQAFTVTLGATPSRAVPMYWNGGIPWVSSGEVSFCRIKDTKETITQAGLDASSTKLNPRGSVLLGMIGEGKTRGQAAILDIDACGNQNAAAIWVSQTEVPPDYVYHYLVGQYETTRRRGSGNNQPALNKARVEAIPLPLPPLDEQTRIVERLERDESTIADSEATVERERKRIHRLRQAILKWAFEGKLVDQDPSDEPADKLLARIKAERAIVAPTKKSRGRTAKGVA